jgi:Ricin-type beta-trefoil lectin domain-like
VNLQQGTIAISAKGHIVDSLPRRSVTTYVIDGVSPSSIPSSISIEGTHQIVSEVTRLCFNINRNTNNSGEAIIPYPCGGFTNMEFNFVDQGNGFYSIHTVNGTQDLCLNISSAASSPGDGKKYGGPGNLIQWSCGSGSSLPGNALFKLVDMGGGRQQMRVKNSGLCLEDPGRGGTIRQNVCSSSPDQTFTLTE